MRTIFMNNVHTYIAFPVRDPDHLNTATHLTKFSNVSSHPCVYRIRHQSQPRFLINDMLK